MPLCLARWEERLTRPGSERAFYLVVIEHNTMGDALGSGDDCSSFIPNGRWRCRARICLARPSAAGPASCVQETLT